MNLKRFLFFTLAGALALRCLTLTFPTDKLLYPDSGKYLQVAQNIVEGKGIIMDERHQAWVPPLYPLFLALHKLAFGDALLPIQLTQIFLSVLSVLLVFIIARAFFDETMARWAAVISAIHPYFVYMAAVILYHALFIFLLLVQTWSIISAVQRKSIWGWFFAGGLCGLSTLTHPGHLFFALFVLVCLLWKRKSISKPALMGVLFVVGNVVVLFPWLIRNYIVLDTFVLTTTHGGYTLYESLGPGATGGPAGDAVHWPKERESMSEVEQDHFLRQKAREYALDHPVDTLFLALKKQLYFWSPIPKAAGHVNALEKVLSALFTAPLILLAFYGMLLARHVPHVAWISLPILYYTLLHLIFVGSILYRLPIEPYLIIFAAYAVVGLFQGRRDYSLLFSSR